MSGDISKSFAVAAVVIVVLATLVLGMVIGQNLKSSPKGTVISAKFADITLVVKGDLSLGSDNKTHDTFVPCNFTIYSGQVVNLTTVNYDDMPHSFTSPTLGIDFQIPSSQTIGVPAVSHFQFSESKAGAYRWWCADPCDLDAGGWAMTTGSDGQPGQIGFMGGFVTVL